MKIDIEKITERQKLIISKGLCDYQYIMKNWKKTIKIFRQYIMSFI